jgi:hypothetical protein
MKKETKDLLNKIISSQEMIMKHLKISAPEKAVKKQKVVKGAKEEEKIRQMPTVKTRK